MGELRTARWHDGHGSHRVRIAAYVVLSVTLSIAAIAALAAVTDSALIFPPLAASAYTIFAHPRARSARPRDVVLGIWLGIAAGYVSALAFGLETRDLGDFDADWRHVGSASLALALTTSLFFAVRVEHPPGCAAALLVALGIWEAWNHALLAAGAVLLVVLGVAVNRAVGLPYPLWRGRGRPNGHVH